MLLKFMQSQHKHFILQQNTLLIRKFSYYRELYEDVGSEWIADPQEGTSVLRLHHQQTEGPPTDQLVQAAARVGLDVGKSNWGPTFNNCQGTVTNRDDFLFCVAAGDPAHLKRTMYATGPGNSESYDACLRIKHEEAFHDALRRGEFRDGNTNELVDLIWRSFELVRYTDGPQDAMEFDHDMLTKRTIFASQSEARLIFSQPPGRRVAIGNTVKVFAPGLSDCFEDIS